MGAAVIIILMVSSSRLALDGAATQLTASPPQHAPLGPPGAPGPGPPGLREATAQCSGLDTPWHTHDLCYFKKNEDPTSPVPGWAARSHTA